MAAEAKVVQLHVKINGENAFNTLKDLNDHIAISRNRLNKMSLDDPGYKAASQKIRECTEKQKAWREEIYGTKKEAKRFTDEFKGGLVGIASAVSVGTLVATGLQSAIGAVSGFFSNAQASWVQGEQTQAQLAAAIKSTGSAAGRTREQLNELSAALQAQTGINSDNIAEAEALLLTFTNISGEIYDQTLPVILDMSKALGEGLKNSAIRAGKALSDPKTAISELKEAGIIFSKEQGKLIFKLQEMGDMAGAQKVILDELARTFGGVAEAVAKTDSGKLEAFNTRLTKIQENIGGFITRIKAGNLEAFEPFVRFLEKATTTNMSSKLQQEQTELNGLIRAISMTNTNQAVRNELIGKLQAKYPEFLGNIKAEDASNELLARRLAGVNAQYREKIFIASNESKISEIQEKRNKAIHDEGKAREEVAKKSKLSAEQLAAMTDKEIEQLAKKQRAMALEADRMRAFSGSAANAAGTSNTNNHEAKNLELILNGRKRIEESLAEEANLMAANATYSAKVKDMQLKAIDAEIAKLKEKNAIQNEMEIKRLEAEKNNLLGIKAKTAPIGPSAEQLKKQASELKTAQNKAIQDFERLDDEYKKLRIKQFADSLEANQKEIQNEIDKYNALILEREKYLKNPVLNQEQRGAVKKQITSLKKDSKASVRAIELKQEKAQIAQLTEMRAQFLVVKEKEIDKEIALINKRYAKLKQDAAGNAKAVALLESYQANDIANVKIREESRFQKEKNEMQRTATIKGQSKDARELKDIKDKYDKQIEVLREKYSEELQITQEFQDALAIIESNRQNEITEKNKQKDVSIREHKIKITEDIANATFTIMANNRQAETQQILDDINSQRDAELSNKELTEEQKKLINDKYNKKIAAAKLKAWQDDKAASLTQAVISGALAFISALKFGPWAAAATAVASAAKIAVIAAQPPPKFGQGGQLPQGLSHASGGIALIDHIGRKVGEIEGGEPILSRETYKNNRQIIDQLLYSSQRLKGASIGINTNEAIKADRMFRYGGIAPTVTHHTTHNVSTQPTDLSILVDKLAQLEAAVREDKARPVDFNYRVFEQYRDQIEAIRAGVAA